MTQEQFTSMPTYHRPLERLIPPGFPAPYPISYGRSVAEGKEAPFREGMGLFLFADSGQGLLTHEGRDYEWSPYCFFALSRPAAIRLFPLGPIAYRYVLLAGQRLDQWLDYLGPYQVLSPEEKGPRLFDAYMGSIAAPERPSLAVLARATCDFFCSMAENCQEKPAAYDELVEDALTIIAQSYPILTGLDDLCARLGVSKGHFIRIFRSALGLSPWQYIQGLRMEDAKLLLLHRDHSVELVANLVGFADANYFCKVFRKATGQSPAAYRKKMGNPSGPSLSAQQRLQDIERFAQL